MKAGGWRQLDRWLAEWTILQGLKAVHAISEDSSILEDGALTEVAAHRPLTVVNADTVVVCTETWVTVTIET